MKMKAPPFLQTLFSIYSIDYVLFFVVVMIILIVKEILVRNKKAKLLMNITAAVVAIIIAVTTLVTTSFGIGLVYKAMRPSQYALTEKSARAQDTPAEEPAVITNVDELRNTIVTPHLELFIPEVTNVIWCVTFQVAWNEFCDLAGGTIQLEPKQQIADVLNRKQITSDVLDPSSFVAIAGLGQKTIDRIIGELERKFDGNAKPQLLPVELPENMWLTYAYLSQHLPFEYAFTRMKSPLMFLGQPVASFGIEQYLPDFQENEAKMAQQVLVYDRRNDNNFIVELIPENREHRIILACIPREKNLNDLIAKVYTRISDNKPTRLDQNATLEIPVIDFNIVKRYSQLIGCRVISSNPDINDTTIADAMQSVRFKLDEKGAALKSEAMMVAPLSEDLIFDRPFLVLLMKRNAKLPYLALWLATPELLTPKSRDFP